MAQNFIDAPLPNEHDPLATPADPQPPGRKAVGIAGGGFLLLILAGAAFLMPKLHHREDLEKETQSNGGPAPVAAAKLKVGKSTGKLELPGTVEGFQQTPIYARTSGYVQKSYVDLGDHVRKGQVLATIEDPQTEQQLRQAQANLLQMKAQLLQARANAKLTTLNRDRYEQLFEQGVVSRATADQQEAQAGANDATVQAALANITAGEANVLSLQEQASFSRVTAPFAGTILARNIDTGSLISAGSSTNVTQLFTIAESERVRVFTHVPQSAAESAMSVKNATVEFRELPGETYRGTISRSSSSVDPVSRTMVAEIDLPNRDHKILPGMFATVTFDLRTAQPPLLLPANALVVRTAGPQAFVVDANKVAHLRNLTLGRDMGSSIEVLSGLNPGDTVILSPGDAVVDGGNVAPQVSTKEEKE